MKWVPAASYYLELPRAARRDGAMDSQISRIDQKSHPAPHFLPQMPKVGLEIVRGKASRKVRDVNPPVFLIGAAADCDLVLGDLRFPEAYAYLYVTLRGVSVRHLGEGPELYVNGELTESGLLADGDLLELGPYEFQVHIQERSPRGRKHETQSWEDGFRENDFLGLDAAMDDVWDLMAQVRQNVALEPVDLRIFSGPPQAAKTPRRPLAAFVARRISA